MVSKATLLHLRIPFSFYLLPFYLFAWIETPNPNLIYAILSFIVIHFFFYPSSNGYNSYYDKDEESIGGLENPPPVSRELLYVSIALEAIAVLLALYISWQFSLMIVGIAMVSRSYSHPAVRLKKYPVLGLIVVALFQGAYTYFMSSISFTGAGFESLANARTFFAGGLCTLMLFGSYPMTQVYQHGEDGRRGDLTMSRLLGIRGTFIWTACIFSIATAGFIAYFYLYYSWGICLLFPLFMLPTLSYFLFWFAEVIKDTSKADFKSTMRLNLLSSLCFMAFFLCLLWLR